LLGSGFAWLWSTIRIILAKAVVCGSAVSWAIVVWQCGLNEEMEHHGMPLRGADRVAERIEAMKCI
jgi:hypothetical protein